MISKIVLRVYNYQKGFIIIRKYSTRNMMKFHERGLFQDIFPSNAANDIVDLCNGAPQCVYAGFDPTANSLHIGNLLVLVSLMNWQRGGHQVIALVGGATGILGDPSERKKEREELDQKSIESNSQAITSSIHLLFENFGKYFAHEKYLPIKIVNNLDWWNRMATLEFLNKTARHCRVGQMMSRSSVQGRSSGLSLMELSYQSLQGYDWLHLLREYNCRFQIGGKDQMGNIMSGHELISRVEDKEVFGITVPLITSEKGDKYGKSGGEAVWLDPARTSPFDLYQFLLRTTDSAVGDLLKKFTFIPLHEINQILQGRPEERKAQLILAKNIVRLVHGDDALRHAENTTKALYGDEEGPETLGKLQVEELESSLKGATVVHLPLPTPGITLGQLLLSAKCFLNIGDMERVVEAGGVRVNRIKMRNPNEVLSQNLHILPNKITLIRVGKRNYWVVRWAG